MKRNLVKVTHSAGLPLKAWNRSRFCIVCGDQIDDGTMCRSCNEFLRMMKQRERKKHTGKR